MRRQKHNVNGMVLSHRNTVLQRVTRPLTELDGIPETVELIYGSALEKQKSLVSAVLPDSVVEVGNRLFAGFPALRQVKLSARLRRISYRMFEGCTSLRKIRIPEGVEHIEAGAFAGSGLTEVVLPSGVLQVDDHAFAGCPLKAVTLPKFVDIHATAFEGCRVERVTIVSRQPGSTPVWNRLPDGFWSGVRFLEVENTPIQDLPKRLQDAALRWMVERELAQQPLSEEQRDSMMQCVRRNRRTLWKDGLFLRLILREEWIPKNQIQEFVSMASELGDSEITAALLEYQNRLISPEEMERRQERKFRQEMRLLEKGQYLVRERKKLWSWRSLDDGTLEIRTYKGSELFVDVPDMVGKKTVSAMGSSVFGVRGRPPGGEKQPDCSRIIRIHVPEGIVRIGSFAFRGCEALETLELPSTLEKFGEGACQSCVSLTSIRLPDRIACLPEVAFYGCGSLKEVVFPGSLQRISRYAFARCSALVRVVLPAGLEEIEDEAFWDCSGMEECILPDSLCRLGRKVFSGCGNLKEIRLPDGITSLPAGIFLGCKELQRVVLPRNLQFIGDYAFTHCAALRSLELPASCRMLGTDALTGTGLEELTLPEGFEVLKNGVFRQCANLRVLTLPRSLKMRSCRLHEELPEVIIRAWPGSPAARYAKNRGMKYEPIRQAGEQKG